MRPEPRLLELDRLEGLLVAPERLVREADDRSVASSRLAITRSYSPRAMKVWMTLVRIDGSSCRASSHAATDASSSPQ